MGLIYKLTSPEKKSWIGQTIRSFDDRWKQHIRDIRKAKKK